MVLRALRDLLSVVRVHRQSSIRLSRPVVAVVAAAVRLVRMVVRVVAVRVVRRRATVRLGRGLMVGLEAPRLVAIVRRVVAVAVLVGLVLPVDRVLVGLAVPV